MTRKLCYTIPHGRVLRGSGSAAVGRMSTLPTLQFTLQSATSTNTSRMTSHPSLHPVSALSLLSINPLDGPKCPSSKTGKVVVWFRADLRMHDHPALNHALEEAETVIPVFCFNPKNFGNTPHGFNKTGAYLFVTCLTTGLLVIHVLSLSAATWKISNCSWAFSLPVYMCACDDWGTWQSTLHSLLSNIFCRNSDRIRQRLQEI